MQVEGKRERRTGRCSRTPSFFPTTEASQNCSLPRNGPITWATLHNVPSKVIAFFFPQTALKSYGKSATFRQHYYPEGGWGWVVAACCFAANAFTFGLQLSFGVMQAELLRHLKEHQVIEIISKNKKNIFLKNYFEGNDAGPVPPPASQRCDGRGGGGGSVGGRGVIIGRHNCGGGEPSGGEAESR